MIGEKPLFTNEFIIKHYFQEEQPRRQQQQPQAQQIRASPRPQTAPQVFRSAEEVNIPLGQRRPQRPYDFDF